MNSVIMRITLIAGIIVYFVLLVYLLKKRTLSIRFSILWFAMGAVMLILAVFPAVLDSVAALLGFEVASNALFSVLFLLILLILLSVSSSVSKYQKQIRELAEKLALLEKKMNDRK